MNPALVDLFVKMERFRFEEAKACVVVTVDQDTGTVVHATGPFTQPELALAQAGRDDASWKRYAAPGEGEFTYHVVPLWEPS